MSLTFLPHRLLHVSIAFWTCGLVFGSVAAETKTIEISSSSAANEIKTMYFSDAQSRYVYNVLAGELYRHQGNLKKSLDHYAAAALHSDDVSVSEQAVELAIETEDDKVAQRIVGHWAELAPDSFEVYQSRALVMARAGEYDTALEDLVYLRDAINKKEKHGFEYIISFMTLELGPEISYELFKRYAEKIENSATVQLSLANLAFSSGDFNKAVNAAKAAADLGDDSVKEQAAHINAKALMNQGDTESALEVLQPFVKQTKQDDIKLDYARMLILLERREEATPWFKQLYASQPDNDGILYTLGLLYLEQKEFAFAEPLIKKLLNAPGRRYDANYFLGQVYEGQERPEDALKAYEASIPGTDFIGEALTRAAHLIKTSKDSDEAIKWLDDQMSELVSDNQRNDGLLIKAQLLQDMKRNREALKVLNEANELRPAYVDTLYMRSLVHESLDDFASAEQDLKQILKDNPESAPALNALGYLLTTNTQRYQEAKDLIVRAKKLNEDDPAITDSLGWVEYKLGHLDEAERHLRQAFEKLPDPEIASHLAVVLFDKGENEEAERLLKDMLKRFPDHPLLVAAREKIIGMSD